MVTTETLHGLLTQTRYLVAEIDRFTDRSDWTGSTELAEARHLLKFIREMLDGPRATHQGRPDVVKMRAEGSV